MCYHFSQFSTEKGFVLHWDGKSMKDLSTDSNVERLPIVGTQSGMERVLRVPKCLNKQARVQTNAIYDTIDEFELTEVVQAVCTDTENTNTGKDNGVVARLERRLKRDLLYLACRHHVHEINLKAVFITKCELNSKSLNVEMFNRLKNNWDNMNADHYKSGL